VVARDEERQRRTLALKVSGYSCREIQSLRGVTCTNVDRHVSEGRATARKLRKAA
jgi:transposase